MTNTIEEKLINKYMEFATVACNPNFRYWITQNISVITFITQRGFYDDYCRDRRTLLKKVCDDLALKIPTKKKNHKWVLLPV